MAGVAMGTRTVPHKGSLNAIRCVYPIGTPGKNCRLGYTDSPSESPLGGLVTKRAVFAS